MFRTQVCHRADVFSSNLMMHLDVISSGVNATPLPSIILLNNPSATPPASSSPYDNYDAPSQASVNSPVINLNAPAPAASPSIIKLNRRQFGSTSFTSTFSFGGIVPSSTALASSFSPVTPTTPSLSSSSFGGTVPSSSPGPAFTTAPSPIVSNGPSTFTSTGANGIQTVVLLATLTVTETGPACSPPAAFSTGSALVPPVSSAAPSSFSPGLSSFQANNAQTPSAIPTLSQSIINLNAPSVTPTPTGFSFSSTVA